MRIDAFAALGPGKFSCRADQRAYRFSLEDGETVAYNDWGDCSTLLDGRLLGLAKAGAIVHSNSDGLVFVDFYDDAEEMHRAWACCIEDSERYYNEQQELSRCTGYPSYGAPRQS